VCVYEDVYECVYEDVYECVCEGERQPTCFKVSKQSKNKSSLQTVYFNVLNQPRHHCINELQVDRLLE